MTRVKGEKSDEKFPEKTVIRASLTRRVRELTPQVEACLHESQVAEGLVLVNAMHITASVFINDNELACTRIMANGWRS